MNNNQRATRKQQELLQFVDGFIKEHGYGPSYREVMKALGYKSVSTVATHIEGLITKGYLSRHDNSPRSLEVITIGTPKSETPAHSTVVDEVTKRLKTADDEQRVTLLDTLELLGYELARKKLEQPSEATPTDG